MNGDRGKFDIGKLVAGGILAGVVMNICDYVSSNFILVNDWDRVARLRNMDMAVLGGTASLVTNIAVDFALGFLIVFIYAAIRPRMGRGPATATVAAFLAFLPEALYMATLASAFYTWDVYVRSQALMLVSYLAGGISGAWIYSEPEDDPD